MPFLETLCCDRLDVPVIRISFLFVMFPVTALNIFSLCFLFSLFKLWRRSNCSRNTRSFTQSYSTPVLCVEFFQRYLDGHFAEFWVVCKIYVTE